jgi:hypothetical protein
MKIPRWHVGLWSRVRLALVLALAVVVLFKSQPSWFEVVRPFFDTVLSAIVFLRLDSLLPLDHGRESAWVVLFLLVAVPLYTAFMYVPGIVVRAGRGLWWLTYPYASTPTFVIYFVLIGTLGAITGLFAWTSSPHVGSTAHMVAYAGFGFTCAGWLGAMLRCYANHGDL